MERATIPCLLMLGLKVAVPRFSDFRVWEHVYLLTSPKTATYRPQTLSLQKPQSGMPSGAFNPQRDCPLTAQAQLSLQENYQQQENVHDIVATKVDVGCYKYACNADSNTP